MISQSLVLLVLIGIGASVGVFFVVRAMRKPQTLTDKADIQEEAPLPAMPAARADSSLEKNPQPPFSKRDEEPVSTVTNALAKTKQGWVSRLSELLRGPSQEKEAMLEKVEEVLYSADIGVKTSSKLLEVVKANAPQEAQQKVADAILEILHAAERPEIKKNGTPGPKVVMFVGVNGVGKTTSIGKLAASFAQKGHSVVLGAGDTFRAAASEQLEVWAERSGAHIVRGADEADPSSVLFDAVSKAKSENADFVLCDTAGRLHTKVKLMDELQKVHRVLGKACDGAPHEVLLVVDATTGQNAIEQARQFSAATPITGVILTKLDGTAKGGVVIGIADELKIPIRYIGVGEGVADLRPFSADEFVKALFEDAAHA